MTGYLLIGLFVMALINSLDAVKRGRKYWAKFVIRMEIMHILCVLIWPFKLIQWVIKLIKNN